MVKPGKEKEAQDLFPDLKDPNDNQAFNITSVGHRYLGSFIGTEEGKDDFIKEKVDQWTEEIDEL